MYCTLSSSVHYGFIFSFLYLKIIKWINKSIIFLKRFPCICYNKYWLFGEIKFHGQIYAKHLVKGYIEELERKEALADAVSRNFSMPSSCYVLLKKAKEESIKDYYKSSIWFCFTYSRLDKRRFKTFNLIKEHFLKNMVPLENVNVARNEWINKQINMYPWQKEMSSSLFWWIM